MQERIACRDYSKFVANISSTNSGFGCELYTTVSPDLD